MRVLKVYTIATRGRRESHFTCQVRIGEMRGEKDTFPRRTRVALRKFPTRANLFLFPARLFFLPSMGNRRLIVNADDFGLTEGVNAGIVEAFEKGILRSASLMANGSAFHDAVRLARANPGLDVGCHLMLISGRAVSQPDRELPRSVPQLLAGLASDWRVGAIEREFSAQIEKIQAARISISHLDTHKTHSPGAPGPGGCLAGGQKP